MSPKLVWPSPRAVESAFYCENKSLFLGVEATAVYAGRLFAIVTDRSS